MKTEHKWTAGWGYDSTVCEHCGVDMYDKHIQYARGYDGGKYCEDVIQERETYLESERTKPARTAAALEKVRAVLTQEEYMLLNLRYFGEYRPRDIITI